MQETRYFIFNHFRLDVVDERLWNEERNVQLGHKAFAVLKSLVRQPNRLITKDDLLSGCWPNTAVSDAVLTTAMREIRRALGDQARVPQYIETVHGRGYRFIARITESSVPNPMENGSVGRENSSKISDRDVAAYLVGRETELAQLLEAYFTVEQGERRIAFIVGEAGMGKTTLAETFISEVSAGKKILVSRGHCVQQYGTGEAYLPILEALGYLSRETSLPVGEVISEHAPSWLAHLSSLARIYNSDGPFPPTSERMLRELADALEILTSNQTLILLLEDLQWSDTATLEALAYVSRRRGPARLLLVCTCRPLDVQLQDESQRSLISDIRLRPQCREIVVGSLSWDAVQTYVHARFGETSRSELLSQELFRLTRGHPLFLATIADELIGRQRMNRPDVSKGQLDPDSITIPNTVRKFIQHRFEQLSDTERRILEAASVAGSSFSVASICAATPLPEETIEAYCGPWQQAGQFLVADGTTVWPDGTVATRYEFTHDLFREVIYALIAPTHRAELHRRIGKRLEAAYENCKPTIAVELAVHFEEGREPRPAVSYLVQAAQNSLRRSAYSEVSRHVVHAQKILESLPENRSTQNLELDLLLVHGQMLMTSKGWGVEEVERVYTRARELSERLDDESRLSQVLWALVVVKFVRAQLRETEALARKLLALATRRRDRLFQLAAHMELGGTAFSQGRPMSARKNFHSADLLYDPKHHQDHIARFGVDVGLFNRIWQTHALWHHGHTDQAVEIAEATLERARQLSHPFTTVITMAYAGMLMQFCGDIDTLEQLANSAIAYSEEHGFPYYRAWAEALLGWCLAARGNSEVGSATIQRGIEALTAIATVRLPYYRALLAEAYRDSGRIEEGLYSINDALNDMNKSEERWWEAELHRLRGELARCQPTNKTIAAEQCFRKAVEVARRQRAKSLELRAVVSLSRLWRDEGKAAEAQSLLRPVYNSFTEGFETIDLKLAKSLLDELVGQG